MRLRAAVAEAVGENRSVAEVARSHRLSWPTVQRAFTLWGSKTGRERVSETPSRAAVRPGPHSRVHEVNTLQAAPDLICEVVDSSSPVVATQVCVCRVPVSA
jgi:hypothetical protein